MRNYYIFIFLLCIFCVVLLVTGFSIAGNPFIVKQVKQDSQRISDFNQIQSAINNYYQQNHMLPKTLDDLKSSNSYLNINIKDPENQKDYAYEAINSTDFKLCTTFARDSKDEKNYQSIQGVYPIDTGNQVNHKKGYDCLGYKVYSYNNYKDYSIATPTPSPMLSSSKFSFLASCDLKNDSPTTSIKITGIYETEDLVVFTTNKYANSTINVTRNIPNLSQNGGATNYYYGQNVFEQPVYPDKSGVNTVDYTIKVIDKSGSTATSEQYTFQGNRTVLSDSRCKGKDIVPTPSPTPIQ